MVTPLAGQLHQGTRQGPVRERVRVAAAVEACLGPLRGSCQVTVSASATLAHWWILEVARPGEGPPRRFFVNGRGEVQREVCRKIVEAVPEACCAEDLPPRS